MARSAAAWRLIGGGGLANPSASRWHQCRRRSGDRLRRVLGVAAASKGGSMMVQLGWATLPGLQGLTVSEFRATPTSAPDAVAGVAMEFANQAECDAFLREIETAFAPRRFTNAADAFDTVKTYALERAARQ